MPLPSSSQSSDPALPRSFYLFWAGQGLSAIGDAMTLVAMPLLVLAESGSVADLGRLTAFSRTGGLVATALAGWVVDRFRPRPVMLLCDLMRCALMTLIPLAIVLQFHRLWLVLLVGVGAALAQGFFYVGHVSLVVDLVGKTRVSSANSRIEGTIALAYVFGPLLAGLFSAKWGPGAVLGFDAVSFLISVLALLAMGNLGRGIERDATRSTPVSRTESRAEVWLAGLQFIRRHPQLSRLTILVATTQLFTAAIVDLFIFRLKHDLGQGDTGTGITFAIAAAASVVAAAMTSRLRARIRFHRLWVVAVALQGSALVLAGQARSLTLLAVAAAVYMAALMTLMICQASLRQELTPEGLLGRVTSAYLVAIALPAPLGALAATALAAHFGAASVQAGIGAALVGTAALASFVWARMPHGYSDAFETPKVR